MRIFPPLPANTGVRHIITLNPEEGRALVAFHSAVLLKATLNKSHVACTSHLRAVCGVANPRDTARYRCGLRLAPHPAAGRAHPRRLIQRRLNARPLEPVAQA